MRRLRHLKDERGFALVMALGMLTVLLITGSTVTYYTVENYRSTNGGSANQRSFALAEAGVNQAVSVLSSLGNDPTNGNLLPGAGSPATQNADGGTISYWGSYNAGTGVWTITG